MSQCQGIAASTGQRCKKTSADGFCHLHKGQATSAARAPAGGSPGKLQHSPSASAAQCQGVTVKGEPCRNSGGEGGFCHHHMDQARATPPQLIARAAPPAPVASISPLGAHPAEKCMGLTLKGEPCRNSGGDGGYCHHHVDQAIAPPTARSEPARAPPAERSEPASRSAHPEDLCRGLTAKGEPCRNSGGKSGYCHHHMDQASAPSAERSEPARASLAERSEPASRSAHPAGKCKGLTLKGEPCRNSGGEGDYCHHHVDEEARASPTKLNEPAPSRSAHPEDLCRGLTLKGELCRNPGGEVGYCHHHVDEAPRSTASSPKSSQQPSHFASFEKLLRDPESELAHFIEAGPSDDDQAGYLYAFLSDDVPDAIKVGFSKPARIDKRLSEHQSCYHDIVKIMDPVNVRLERLAENSVKSILRHFGEELKVDCPSGKHDHQHIEWFKARSGVGLGEWRDTVEAAINWVSRTKSTGGRDEKR